MPLIKILIALLVFQLVSCNSNTIEPESLLLKSNIQTASDTGSTQFIQDTTFFVNGYKISRSRFILFDSLNYILNFTIWDTMPYLIEEYPIPPEIDSFKSAIFINNEVHYVSDLMGNEYLPFNWEFMQISCDENSFTFNLNQMCGGCNYDDYIRIIIYKDEVRLME